MAPSGSKVIATNRRARRDFEILDTVECGLVLRGSEVKSLREAKVNLAESYGRLADGEVWLNSLHIAPYSSAGSAFGHDPDRPKKLLLHRSQIERLRSRIDQERLSLVPLSLYFRDGKAKIELGLGKGKRRVDRRHDIAKRDAELEARRAMARARRGS